MDRRALGLVPRRRPHHVRVTAPVREVRLVRRRVQVSARRHLPAARPGPGGPNRPRPCTRCIRPFEAEEVWQAPSPEQLPAPQSQDSLFQEDEPSTPLTRYYEDDYETERDLERMKNLIRRSQRSSFRGIEDVCDQMEYEGSLMYDESPDQNPGPPPDFPDLRAGEGTVPAPGREDKDEMLAMNQETWRRYPPDQNWLSDLIQTLLVDEMFRRRSRRRNSRQWS